MKVPPPNAKQAKVVNAKVDVAADVTVTAASAVKTTHRAALKPRRKRPRSKRPPLPLTAARSVMPSHFSHTLNEHPQSKWRSLTRLPCKPLRRSHLPFRSPPL